MPESSGLLCCARLRQAPPPPPPLDCTLFLFHNTPFLPLFRKVSTRTFLRAFWHPSRKRPKSSIHCLFALLPSLVLCFSYVMRTSSASKLHVLFLFGPSSLRLHSDSLCFFFSQRSLKTRFDAYNASFCTVERATGAPSTPPYHAMSNFCLTFLFLLCLASFVHGKFMERKKKTFRKRLQASSSCSLLTVVFAYFSSSVVWGSLSSLLLYTSS